MKRWKLLLLATGVLIGTVGRARTVEAAGNTYAFSASTKVRSTRAQLSLSAAPATLNFGSVTVGSRAAQTVTLTNTGNSSVSVTAVGVPAGFITSGLTTTLASSQTATFSVIFAPTSTGSVTGNATVFSNASNSVTIALTGSGVQAGLSVTPQSLSFGNVVVGTTNSQTISVSNQGTANLVISQATVSGSGFGLSGLTIPLTLAPTQSTSFSVVFSPVNPGGVTGGISLVSNAPNSPTSIPLNGTGVTPTLQLGASPTSLTFGNVAVGSSAVQTVTLTNTGNSSVSVSAISVPAGFVTSGLTTTLAPGQSATFSVTFAPTSAGNVTGNANVISNASNAVAVPLTGSGVQPTSAGISVTPSSVNFGSVVVGSPNTQPITLTNSGTANLSISQATVSGSGFALSGLTIPLTLAPSQSTSFSVAFSPVNPGGVTGGVSLVSNAPGSPANIPLSGTGVAATLQLNANPTSLSFGDVTVGSSAAQSVTLTNTGNSSVSISQVTVPSGFLAGGLNTTLAAGQTATFSVTFAPTSTGSVTGSASVVSNASNAVTIALTGSGVQTHSAALVWNASASAVAGYNIYRGNASGGPYAKVNASLISVTNYQDSTVQAGQSYYYVVTAVDASNLESVYSNEASGVIPTP